MDALVEEDQESPELAAQSHPQKVKGFCRVLPLSGAKCFGDHCDFVEKIKVLALSYNIFYSTDVNLIRMVKME